jgi:hypothetical protein
MRRISFSIHFMAIHFVRILNPGPADRAWARAIREDTQEECFLYADDTKTVPHKQLAINTLVRVETFRAVEDEGRTRWKTNAFPLAMQSEEVQRAVVGLELPSGPEQLELSAPVTVARYSDYAFTRKTLYAKATQRRRQKIAEIIERQQLTNKDAVGDAVGIAIDLCIEHNLS